ncbi:hypothetical protein HQ560_04225, partial [bacterium]|nr:hypothetical protein [bacterium]
AGSGRQALHRLRTWLVLALRCLALAALALVFVRPYLQARGADARPGAAQRAVLVVDASLSQRAVQGGVPLFARARAEAADALRALEPGSLAGVIFIGAQPRPALPALSQNLASLHDALLDAQPTLEAGDPAAALALARRMLGDDGSILVFSDFQRTNWSAVSLDDLGDVRCTLRPVTDRPVPNVAVTAVDVSPAEPMVGEPVEVTCTVFNGTPARRQESVRLDLPGVTREKTLALQPYSSGRVSFSLSLPAVGIVGGTASLGPDDLVEDNVRAFGIRVRDALRVLVLSSAEPTDRRSAAFFVATALSPSEGAGTGLTVVRRHCQDVDRGALEAANAFVLVAPAELPGEAAQTLARRVTDGALLMVLLDGPTAPHILGVLGAGSVTAPFQLTRPVIATDARGESLAGVHVADGPLRLFADPAHGSLERLRFRRHYLTQTLESRQEEALATFADGSVALALSPAGRGAAVFANLSIAPHGGNLVGSPLFPALLQELLRALRRADEGNRTTPGRTWHIDAPAAEGEAWTVTGPDGEPAEATVVARGRTVRLALPAARAVGHYRVHADGALAALGVANVDPRESDTRSVPLATLAPAGGPVAVADRSGQLLTLGAARPIWPWLAGLAAAFLALEMIVLALWRTKAVKAA